MIGFAKEGTGDVSDAIPDEEASIAFHVFRVSGDVGGRQGEEHHERGIVRARQLRVHVIIWWICPKRV